MRKVYCLFIIWVTILTSLAKTAQIDTVVLDELLREIVDSSMSDLRHRLQEAVFATSFRRKILEQHGTSSENSEVSKASSLNTETLEKLLLDHDHIKPQKLSLSLETFTRKPSTTTTTAVPVQLVTADDVAISESGRLFKDDVAYSESSSFLNLPRVPAYVAIIVFVMCAFTFLLLLGTIVYFLTSRCKRTKTLNLPPPHGMLDPLSVQGLSTCHVSPNHRHSLNMGSEFPKFSNSRRNSLYLDQDRATSSIWAHP